MVESIALLKWNWTQHVASTRNNDERRPRRLGCNDALKRAPGNEKRGLQSFQYHLNCNDLGILEHDIQLQISDFSVLELSVTYGDQKKIGVQLNVP